VTSAGSAQSIDSILRCRNNGYVLSLLCAVPYLVWMKEHWPSFLPSWCEASAGR